MKPTAPYVYLSLAALTSRSPLKHSSPVLVMNCTRAQKVSPDGKQVLQKVELVGNYPDTSKRVVDVQLTRDEETECWLIDAISFVPL